MRDALQIIIAKSPVAGRDAIQCLRAVDVKSPAVQHRYNRVVELAFGDYDAHFTPAERETIAGYVDSTDGEARTTDIRVRLTLEEKATLQEMAADAGQNVSDYVRGKVGL